MKIPKNASDPLLTPMEAAFAFRVHLSTVYRMMAGGEIEPVMVRGYKRIPESEIARALAVKKVS